MQVNYNNRNMTFKGYDARRLKALCMTYPKEGVAQELTDIGKKVGFDVFVQNKERNMVSIMDIENPNSLSVGDMWSQDIVALTPDKKFVAQSFLFPHVQKLRKLFDKCSAKYEIEEIPAGGNFYFIKNSDNTNKLLLGINDESNIHNNPAWLKDVYGVEKVDFVPQMDFHIDMFLRPLENGKILLADDDMTMGLIRTAIDKFNEYSNRNVLTPSGINARFVRARLECLLKKYRKMLLVNFKYAKTRDVRASLESKGYEVISVPGRVLGEHKLVSGEHVNLLNYMNAIVTKNNNNELVYITNKSPLDKYLGISGTLLKDVGFSFEEEFLKSIEKFIKRENVYFVSGKKDHMSTLLKDYNGGIHCLVTEIPDNL